MNNFNSTQKQEVAVFKGQQVTGVTVSDKGRIFANFPRWRKGVENSVVEVVEEGKPKAFPNPKWNSWTLGDPTSENVFVAVQSVVAFENNLYVLDTRNPLFNGVIENPRVFMFDLLTNEHIKTFILQEGTFHKDSYINDLRIDKKRGKIYLTDSGHAGLVVVDLKLGTSFRVLNDHNSTLAETDFLNFSGSKWVNTVHSDGIALDTKNDLLYYHALTGYSLYAVSTDILAKGNQKEIEDDVKFIMKTSAPDGMIFDEMGNLYLGDLEYNKIMKVNPVEGAIETFYEGEDVRWADTFSIYKDTLYYTNSRINEANDNIDNLSFTINKLNIK
ncbi:major royal jelly protein [Formosa agariphila KMM 3901]|uniref:Major royal jelly protein n=2 Tax=Formosa TaxID=225842 RepID=T2KQL1_FORAG|nr:major royal jelly protein [Formosa agariphila KMM 3901]